MKLISTPENQVSEHPQFNSGSSRTQLVTDHDLVCFSALRWSASSLRTRQLLLRAARQQRVFFIEEPVRDDSPGPRLELSSPAGGIRVARLHLPLGLNEAASLRTHRQLLDRLFREQHLSAFITWYCSPLALQYSRHLQPSAVVYDCCDQADPDVPTSLELELLELADVVFTDGQARLEELSGQHRNIHSFPSSPDQEHFRLARAPLPEPAGQAELARPRLGYPGPIDDRVDFILLGNIARARPDWQIILLGKVAAGTPALPDLPNLHYFTETSWSEVPSYLAGWDAALLPLAYGNPGAGSGAIAAACLAAGKRVVSTAVRDVMLPYGRNGLVHISYSEADFIAGIETALAAAGARHDGWLAAVDDFLDRHSWDSTWSGMLRHVAARLRSKSGVEKSGN